MTSNIFIWLILTYICYQECKAFIPSRIDLISFSNNNNNINQQLIHSLYKRSGVDKRKSIKVKRDTASINKKISDKSEISSYNDIIENLRKDWQMPSIYLEKRGYFNKVPKSLISRIQDETQPKREELVIPKKLKSCCNCPNGNAGGCKPLRKTKKSRHHPKQKVKRQLEEIDFDISNEDTSENGANPVNSEVTPTTKAPGFLQKVKNVFSHKNKTALVEDVNSFAEHSTDFDRSTGKGDSYQKFVEFRYDDSWLHDPGDEESEFYNAIYPSLYKRKTKNSIPAIFQHTINQKGEQQKHTSSHNIFTKDLNYDEVFKNLTQVDIDYVKNFLKCYKENKSKFLVDYLHVNASASPETKITSSPDRKITSSPDTKITSSSEKNQSAVTTAKPIGGTTTTTTTIKPDVLNATALKNATTTVVTSNATVIKDNKINHVHNISITTEVEPSGNKTGKNNTINVPKTQNSSNTDDTGDEMKLGLDIKANETGEGRCFNYHKKGEYKHHHGSSTQQPIIINPEMIKFLAHLHHNVYEVGRPRHKPIDLKMVQKLIDEARHSFRPVVLGDGDSKNCTSIRLNGLSFDLEVGGPSSTPEPKSPLLLSRFARSWPRSGGGVDGLGGDHDDGGGTDNDWNENQIISRYLADFNSGSRLNSFLIEPPYSDNFLDQADEVDGDSHEQDINKGNGLLTKFTKKREVARSEDEVLSDISSSLDKYSSFNGPSLNFDDNYDDYLSEKDNTLDEKISKERDDDYPIEEDVTDDQDAAIIGRLRKKMKRKKKKKNKKLRLRNDIDPLKLDISINDPLKEEHDEKHEEKHEEKITFKKDQIPQSREWLFTDLSDIKFRVNPEQEEDIQKFIVSLNSPPEIFSFDVDKYIKQPEDKLTEDAHIETLPQRTYYEFMDTPSVESDQIPFIQPEKISEKETRSSDTDLTERSNGKRDLLKQYIKGVSNRLNQIDHPMYELEEEGAKTYRSSEKNKEEVAPPIRENLLLGNYANNLDTVNYKQYKSPKNNDDEYDDFVDKYYLLNDGSVQIYEPKHSPKALYDPKTLAIDLDLDKKFRELSLSGTAPLKEETEIINENKGENERGIVDQEHDIIAVAPETTNIVNYNNFDTLNNGIDTSSYTKQNTQKRKVQRIESNELAKKF